MISMLPVGSREEEGRAVLMTTTAPMEEMNLPETGGVADLQGLARSEEALLSPTLRGPEGFQTRSWIPESSEPPNPLAEAAGKHAWELEDEWKADVARERRVHNQERMDEALLEPDEFFKRNPLDPRGFPDEAEGRRDVLISRYVRSESGWKLPAWGPVVDIAQEAMAEAKFGGKGAEDKDEFFRQMVAEAQGRKDTRGLLEGGDAASREKSLAGRMHGAVLNGEGWEAAFLTWQREAAGDPRYDKRKLADYMEAAEAGHARVSERFNAARPYAMSALAALRRERDEKGAYGGDDTVRAILAAPAEMRPLVLGILSHEAAKEGETQAAGGHVLQTFARGMARQMLLGPASTLEARSLVDAERTLAEMKPGDEFGGRFRSLENHLNGVSTGTMEGDLLGLIFEPFLPNKVVTEESLLEAKAQLRERKEAFTLSKQLEQIGQGALDPLRADGWVSEKIIYPFVGSAVPSIASVAFTRGVTGSGAGAILPMWGMMADQNAQQLLAENPGMSFEMAYDLGQKAAVFQSGMEYAETALALGSTKLLGNTLRTARASPLKVMARAAATNTVAMNATEAVQDVTPYIVQALHESAPEVDVEKLLSGENGFWRQRVDTFWSLLPAVVMGSAGSAIRAKASAGRLERIAEAAKDDLLMKAAGIDEAKRQAMRDEPDAGKRLDMMISALAEPDAETAVQGQAELEIRQREAHDAESQAKHAGLVPEMLPDRAGGWKVVDGRTGETMGEAADPSGAARLVDLHRRAQEGKVTSRGEGEKGGTTQSSVSPLSPIGPGRFEIREAPALLSFRDELPAEIRTPAGLRKVFWDMFDTISAKWPKVLHLAEGPVAWSKANTGKKLRSFKPGESARLHYIAAQNLPSLLENSVLAAVLPDTKGDRTVAEIHRRYAWAIFPDGTRRNVLLTVKRMSMDADADKRSADQAYSAEVLEVTGIEVLPENKSADAVNLKTGGEPYSPSSQANAPTPGDSNLFLAGIKPEHRWTKGNGEASDSSADQSGKPGNASSLEVSQGKHRPAGTPRRGPQPSHGHGMNAEQKSDYADKRAEQTYIKVVEKLNSLAKASRTYDESSTRKRKVLLGDELKPTPEERVLLLSPGEILLVYAADGTFLKIVTTPEGHRARRVVLRDDIPPDAILCHHHPNGRVPSPQDLAAVLMNPGMTFRVILRNEHGKVELFSMKATGRYGASQIDAVQFFYQDYINKVHDRHDGRREGFALTLEMFGHMIKSRKMLQ